MVVSIRSTLQPRILLTLNLALACYSRSMTILISSIILISLGWPAVIVGMLISLIGLYLNRIKLILLAAAIITPFSLYFIGANNWMAIIYPFMPLCILGSWYFKKNEAPLYAWLFTLLAILAFLYLAFVLFA